MPNFPSCNTFRGGDSSTQTPSMRNSYLPTLQWESWSSCFLSTTCSIKDVDEADVSSHASHCNRALFRADKLSLETFDNRSGYIKWKSSQPSSVYWCRHPIRRFGCRLAWKSCRCSPTPAENTAQIFHRHQNMGRKYQNQTALGSSTRGFQSTADGHNHCGLPTKLRFLQHWPCGVSGIWITSACGLTKQFPSCIKYSPISKQKTFTL